MVLAEVAVMHSRDSAPTPCDAGPARRGTCHRPRVDQQHEKITAMDALSAFGVPCDAVLDTASKTTHSRTTR